MPDGRMLKKAITTSKKLAELKTDTARLLYTWLIPFLDIEGRYFADPYVIKGAIFPRIISITPEMISDCLADMQRVNLIVVYCWNGDSYLQYEKFKYHQSLRADKESPSRIPAPGENGTSPVQVPEQSGSGAGDVPLKISKDKLSLNNPTPDQVRLVSLLKDFILRNNPQAVINDKSWINHCRLMIERDNRSIEDIEKVMEWCQNSEFWKPNILSMKKLREKFDQLYMQMKSNGGNKGKIKAFDIDAQIKPKGDEENAKLHR